MTTLTLASFKSQKGFTLLELLTTLAIVSLLIMVAYPVYTQHTIKARRAHAQIALLDLASALEQYHVLKNTYAGATLADLKIDEYAGSKTYHLEMENLAENSYLVKAVPQGVQEKDILCGILSLDASGRKGMTGKGTDCW